MSLKIIIGSDHAGYEMKSKLMFFLKNVVDIGEGIDIEDMGTYSTESVDYPDQALCVSERIISFKKNGVKVLGILICGTGIGISIAANKVPGIRAANCHNEFTAQMAREHNDANILVLGSRVIDLSLAEKIVRIFLTTQHAGDRHKRRVQKIIDIEKKYFK